MNSSSLLERARKCTPSSLRIFVQFMGGGPRTFPGGINKWQWKRLHEKRAIQKEKRLLEQERQIYEARIRSEIRSRLAGTEEMPRDSRQGPLSSKDQIKLLADRFMKDGAEDLWNENDGPSQSLASSAKSNGNIRSSCEARQHLDLNKLIHGGRRLADEGKKEVNLFRSENAKFYSVFATRRNVDTKLKAFWRNENIFSEDESDEHLFPGDVRSDARFKKLSSDIDGERDDFLRRQHKLSKVPGRLESEDASENKEKSSTLREKRFDELKISPLTVKALAAAGFVQLTKAQAYVLPACIEGKDALVKANGGAGKSVTFLIPSIEAAMNAISSNGNRSMHRIHALLLCPTRESASQIAAELNAMLRYHNGIHVQTLCGGKRFIDDLRTLKERQCEIVVATPGRLLDHIEHKGGLSVHLTDMKLLVLDDVDRLIDLGFWEDIENIIDCLPRQRQTLLFTASVPKQVKQLSLHLLKKGYTYIDTVSQESINAHSQVKQSYLIMSHELHFKLLYHLIKDHISQVPNYKVIIFCSNGMISTLVYTLLHHLKMNARELHRLMLRNVKSRVLAEFKEAERIILVTSDILPRRVHSPDISLVLQVGIPVDREQYLRRVGASECSRKSLECVLILSPWEQHFLDSIKDLPIRKLSPVEIDQETHSKVESSILKIDRIVKENAYNAWLENYISAGGMGRSKGALAENVIKFSQALGLRKSPRSCR